MRFRLLSFALLLAVPLNAGIIASTLGSTVPFTPNAGYLIGNNFDHGVELAVPFEPYEDRLLSSIRFAVFDSINSTTHRLVLDISTGPLPSTPIETFHVQLNGQPGGSLYTVPSVLNPLLLARQTYWLLLSSDDLTHNAFGWNTGGAGEFSLIAERSPGFSLWTLFYVPTPAFEITGIDVTPARSPTTGGAVPEPSTSQLACMGGFLLLAGVLMRSATFEQNDRLLKVAEACQLLSYSRATVYRFIALGKLPVVKVAGTIRFRYQSLLKWMADHETSADSASSDQLPPPSA